MFEFAPVAMLDGKTEPLLIVPVVIQYNKSIFVYPSPKNSAPGGFDAQLPPLHTPTLRLDVEDADVPTVKGKLPIDNCPDAVPTVTASVRIYPLTVTMFPILVYVPKLNVVL